MFFDGVFAGDFAVASSAQVFGVMRSKDVPITEVAVTAVQLSELVKLIDSNTLSGCVPVVYFPWAVLSLPS